MQTGFCPRGGRRKLLRTAAQSDGRSHTTKLCGEERHAGRRRSPAVRRAFPSGHEGVPRDQKGVPCDVSSRRSGGRSSAASKKFPAVGKGFLVVMVLGCHEGVLRRSGEVPPAVRRGFPAARMGSLVDMQRVSGGQERRGLPGGREGVPRVKGFPTVRGISSPVGGVPHRGREGVPQGPGGVPHGQRVLGGQEGVIGREIHG